MSELPTLAVIREQLIRQEDTIIFALIERAQYAHNPLCYAKTPLLDPDDNPYSPLTGSDKSLLDFMLLETERLHARARRYASPDEYAFFPDRLPAPQLPLVDTPEVLHPCIVNLNSEIMDMYLTKLLPALCRGGDDGQHGSSVVADIAVLQAISKRVHYGFFVAETKFQEKKADYTALIQAEDQDAIMKLLTNAAVEARVLERVRLKAKTFGVEIQAPSSAAGGAPQQAQPAASGHSSPRVDPDLIVALYEDHMIPLTKVGEVAYLLQRLSTATIAHHGSQGSACHSATVQTFVAPAPAGKTAPLLLRCSDAKEVFDAVTSNKASYGVVLFEQGDSGVLSTTRSLLRASSLRVVGEATHRGRFALVSKASLASITRLRGRTDMLRLCSSWLRELGLSALEMEELPMDANEVHVLPWHGVLDAVDQQSTAYLVESECALDPALRVLANAPPTAASDYARCILIAKLGKMPQRGPSGHDKTMLLFSLMRDKVGSLADVLAIVDKHGINMRSIQSYPDLDSAGRVTFFTEVDGHEHEASLSRAIEELRACACFLKVLGSFPTGAMGMATSQRPSPRASPAPPRRDLMGGSVALG